MVARQPSSRISLGSLRLSATACNEKAKAYSRNTFIMIARTENTPIFEWFCHIDRARSRDAGLGLAIGRHIAHAHNGDVFVDSLLGKGRGFNLHIPFA